LPKRPKVVILGAGFAGVAAAKTLSRHSEIETTLVDRSRFQVFHASLYEAATEEVTRETVLIPLEQIFSGSRVAVVKAEVASVDQNKRQVYLKGGDVHDYDYLILALGAVGNDFGINAYYPRRVQRTVRIRRDGAVLHAFTRQLQAHAPLHLLRKRDRQVAGGTQIACNLVRQHFLQSQPEQMARVAAVRTSHNVPA